MSKSNYLENKVLDHILGGPDYTRPATVYIALFSGFSTLINWMSDTDVLTEIAGNGYARLAVANNSTNFPAASAGQKSNGTAFTFAVATGGSWSNINAVAVFDALTGGNLLFWANITDVRAAYTVPAGQQANFAAGALIFVED